MLCDAVSPGLKRVSGKSRHRINMEGRKERKGGREEGEYVIIKRAYYTRVVELPFLFLTFYAIIKSYCNLISKHLNSKLLAFSGCMS